MTQPLIIVGASARAAAQSAARGGFAPYAADLFADEDLRACCPAVQVSGYPAGLEDAAREFPPGSWMYTGGLENHPALVDRIARERPLLGHSGEVLRAVRDPLALAAALREAGLNHLETSLSPLAHTRCLRKPKNSCGGMRIEFVDKWNAAKSSGAWYYQAYAAGAPAAAIYIATNSQAVLLGVTRQLVGEAWTGARPFRYCGSLGPLALSDARRTAYEQLGACLAERFNLCGLFGVDVVENEAGIWPVEVNPRYTASVEILERACSLSAVALHAAACASSRHTPCAVAVPTTLAKCHAKAVLFAQDDITIGREVADFISCANEGLAWPTIADVPRYGAQIRSGQPVFSIFAAGGDVHETMQALRNLARSAPFIATRD